MEREADMIIGKEEGGRGSMKVVDYVYEILNMAELKCGRDIKWVTLLRNILPWNEICWGNVTHPCRYDTGIIVISVYNTTLNAAPEVMYLIFVLICMGNKKWENKL